MPSQYHLSMLGSHRCVLFLPAFLSCTIACSCLSTRKLQLSDFGIGKSLSSYKLSLDPQDLEQLNSLQLGPQFKSLKHLVVQGLET
ncbi:hypothetical protein FGO68_gene239 [Halteria grandinella]|uniref:Uncharacterized protein n=1 Tax=Halteria grandinella TaxID=5974 RepID=A0A8J8N8U3_HALGN|nr:hypothetical protein FGO68_gene239 [Halteria grandinella]